MNWEKSKACTPLKRDILRAWFEQESRYFLTGGSALGIFYLEHRRSYDLDLFTCEEVAPKEVQNLIRKIASQIDAQSEAIRTTLDFHRFRLSRDGGSEVVDVVMDRSPQLDQVKVLIGGVRVDTLREMIANKLTTILSRSEMKDVVDLYFLEQAGHDLIAAIPDAREKDGGWDPAVVSMLLNSLSLDDPNVLFIKELDQEDFKVFLKRFRLAIANLALP